MRAGNGLRSDKGFLSATDFDSSRQLQALMLAASGKKGELEHEGSIIIRDADGAAALVIHSVSLSHSMAIAARGDSRAVGLLIFGCQTGDSGPDHGVFRTLFLDGGGDASPRPLAFKR